MCLMSAGEVLGLLGPNGAGKSSVMHMLSGDTDPTAGQVRFSVKPNQTVEKVTPVQLLVRAALIS